MANANPPEHPGPEHDHLAVFIGKWHAEGTSYGPQEGSQPKTTPWISDETVEKLDGGFFLVQRWTCDTGGYPFNGLGIIGFDPDRGDYFSQTFENHGYERRYKVHRDGRVWTFDGETERARYEFSADGRTQTIAWEWKPPGQGWTKLCDRIARRVD